MKFLPGVVTGIGITSLVVLVFLWHEFSQIRREKAFLEQIREKTLSEIESPHARALYLVLQTSAQQFKKIDEPTNWNCDMKQREWIIQRPIECGTFNSSPFLLVSYKIEGKQVAFWNVTLTRNEAVYNEKISQ